MANYKSIKGATELINKYAGRFETIDKSIEELKKKKDDLQEKLDNSLERFSLESIENNADMKRDLNLYDQYLKEAYSQREQLEQEVEKEAYSETLKVLKEHGKTERGKHNHINKAIIEHLYTIRNLYEELEHLENEEQKKVNAFIGDVFPYMSKLDKYNNERNEYGTIRELKQEAFTGRGIFGKVNESIYGAKGVLKADTEIRRLAGMKAPKPSDLNKFYNVDEKQAEIMAKKSLEM